MYLFDFWKSCGRERKKERKDENENKKTQNFESSFS